VLELPSTGWLRRYRVRAHGTTSGSPLDKLKDGVSIEGVMYGAIDATLDKRPGFQRLDRRSVCAKARTAK
jgi:23S rRNA pseudouridine2605 synthase